MADSRSPPRWDTYSFFLASNAFPKLVRLSSLPPFLAAFRVLTPCLRAYLLPGGPPRAREVFTLSVDPLSFMAVHFSTDSKRTVRKKCKQLSELKRNIRISGECAALIG